MTKLAIALSKISSTDGSKIDIGNISRMSLTLETTDKTKFELLAWEAKRSTKTYRIMLPMKHYTDICIDVAAYSKDEVEDPFEITDGKRKTKW